MIVYCDLDECIHWKENRCSGIEISLSNGECDDYEQKEEEKLTDMYYIQIAPYTRKEEYIPKWEKRWGKKIQVLGREMFNTHGRVTDGRTGAFVGYESDFNELEFRLQKYLPRFIEAEKFGISPLYKNVKE